MNSCPLVHFITHSFIHSFSSSLTADIGSFKRNLLWTIGRIASGGVVDNEMYRCITAFIGFYIGSVSEKNSIDIFALLKNWLNRSVHLWRFQRHNLKIISQLTLNMQWVLAYQRMLFPSEKAKINENNVRMSINPVR